MRIPVQRWQLLGPMTAMNGVLLFGRSTAIILPIVGQNFSATKRLPCNEA